VSVQCPPSCAACLSSTICTSCNPGYYFQPNQTCSNSISCGSRTFFNNQTQNCQNCPYDCLTCYTDNTCASCSSSDNRQLDLATHRCVPLSQYFDNQTTVCPPCPANCLVCKSLALCTVCLSGAYMSTVNNLCYTQCPARQFANSQSATCQSCPYDCYTCNADGTCLSCSGSGGDNRQLDTFTKRCVAMPKFFDNLTQICVSCPSECAICTSLLRCSSCVSGLVLTSDLKCSSSYPPRSFINPITQLYQLCPYDCLTCNSDGLCLSCSPSDNRVLDSVTSRCIPMPKYF